MSEAAPVLVETTRGALVECRHRGIVAVVDATGRHLIAQGNVERPVYARSALKPLQALPLVTTGAADRFGLGDRELSLACASHHAETTHIETVTAWLARIGLDAGDLECGAHPPTNADAARALLLRGEQPSALHNNCSGKHTGFLTTARHLGEVTRGYIAYEHPVQRRILAAVEAMTGLDLRDAPRGIDGCGIPVIAIPLARLALAMARMVDPQGVPAELASASHRLLDAMAAEPLMVSGSTGFATAVLRAAGDTVRLKPGAEGVYCAALPKLGLGVALKIDDGAQRAAEVAMGALLLRLGALDEAARQALDARLHPPIRNVAGLVVGELRATAALAAS